MIVLYGATGYTGRLVTRELVERGADFVLGGRSREKLEGVSAEHGRDAPIRVASIDDPASLRALLDGADVLINCAGPFTHAGEPVVQAAVDAGVHYVDSTGEQTFIQMVFEKHGPTAERKGIALIPACGFDYVPGDCIARIAARGHEPLEELVIAYYVKDFGMSRGTMLSALEMMKGDNATIYADGEWREWQRGIFRASFDFGGKLGRQPMAPYPAGEMITVPRHTDVRNVTTLLTTRTAMPGPMVPLAPFVMPLFAQLLRTPLSPLLARGIDMLPEGPEEDARRAAEWTIVAQGTTVSGDTVRAEVSGKDVYGLTARALVLAAEQLGPGGTSTDAAGALGPAAAFDPEAMLEAIAEFGVAWRSDTAPEAVH